jgi:hypothetical protein
MYPSDVNISARRALRSGMGSNSSGFAVSAIWSQRGGIAATRPNALLADCLEDLASAVS